MRKLGTVVCLFLFASACGGVSETVAPTTTSVAPSTTTVAPTTTGAPTMTAAPTTTTSTTTTTTTSTTTTTTTSTIPPTDTLVEYVDTPRELVRIPVDVICGSEGPEAEFLIEGEPVESELQRWVDFGMFTYPQPTGWDPPEVGPITYEYVLGAYDTEDTDYVFEGGWWIVDSTDPENITCEQYQGPEWTKYVNRDLPIGEKKLIEWTGIATEESESTESGFKQESDIQLREPHSCTDPQFGHLKEDQDCFLTFDYVIETTTDGKFLQMGFDCASDGVGSQWVFIDGVLEGATYYHPPEAGPGEHQQFLVEPSRDLYGPSSYLPTVFVEQQEDGSMYVFDAGLSRTDWNLTATTSFDELDWKSDYDGEIYSMPNWNNCTLIDWTVSSSFGTPLTPPGLIKPSYPSSLDIDEKLTGAEAFEELTSAERREWIRTDLLIGLPWRDAEEMAHDAGWATKVIFAVEGEPVIMTRDLSLGRLRLVVFGGEEAGTVVDVVNS